MLLALAVLSCSGLSGQLPNASQTFSLANSPFCLIQGSVLQLSDVHVVLNGADVSSYDVRLTNVSLHQKLQHGVFLQCRTLEARKSTIEADLQQSTTGALFAAERVYFLNVMVVLNAIDFSSSRQGEFGASNAAISIQFCASACENQSQCDPCVVQLQNTSFGGSGAVTVRLAPEGAWADFCFFSAPVSLSGVVGCLEVNQATCMTFSLAPVEYHGKILFAGFSLAAQREDLSGAVSAYTARERLPECLSLEAGSPLCKGFQNVACASGFVLAKDGAMWRCIQVFDDFEGCLQFGIAAGALRCACAPPFQYLAGDACQCRGGCARCSVTGCAECTAGYFSHKNTCFKTLSAGKAGVCYVNETDATLATCACTAGYYRRGYTCLSAEIRTSCWAAAACVAFAMLVASCAFIVVLVRRRRRRSAGRAARFGDL